MKPEKGTILPAVRERFDLEDHETIRAHVIVSGAPKGRKRRENNQHIIQEKLEAIGVKTTINVTKSAEHAKELTADAIKKNAHIVVYYSGDGGFHTGVNVQEKLLSQTEGLLDPNRKKIRKPINLFVPGGTMDIAGRANGIPRRNVKKAMEKLLTGKIVDRDLIKMTAGDEVRYGVVLAGFGAAARITNYVDSSGKRGPHRYFVESFKHHKEIKPRKVIFSNMNKWHDQYELDVQEADIMNGGPFGGWFHILPNNAKLDDGLADLVAIMPKGAFLSQALKLAVRTRTRLSFPRLPLPDVIRGMRGEKIIARTADGKAFGPVHADGEATTTDASVIVFESVKHAMTQVVPMQKAA